MSPRLSRRTFLQAATATAAASYATRAVPRSAAPADRGTVAINTPLNTFSYSEVELFDSPLKRQFEENHARFLHLEDDRMLKVFRQDAGLPAPGEEMGGWYDGSGFSLERGDFTLSSPATTSDNSCRAWRGSLCGDWR